MKNFEVICTEGAMTGFFEDFLSSMGLSNGDDDNLSVYLNWKRLLFKESYLILDIPKEDYDELAKTNPMYLLLEKSCQAGGSKVSVSPDIFEHFEKCGNFAEFVSPIYISEKESKEFISQHGRLFLSRSEMNNTGQVIFKDSKFIISKKETSKNTVSSWDALAPSSLPLSDIIIIDNYLIKKGSISNITDMLRGVIPKDQENSKIRLTIITSLYDETQDKIETITELWYLKLAESLKSKFKSFSFDISIAIISLRNLNHDRAVLTNYIWIDSGHGFNCFNERGLPKVTTIIKCMPIFSSAENYDSSSSTFDCWSTMRDHAKMLIKSSVYQKGNFNNNLLLKE